MAETRIADSAPIRAVAPGVPLVVAALGYALLAQGGYFGRAQLVVALILLGALVLLPAAPRLAAADGWALVPAAGLAGWALADAVGHGQVVPGIRYVALLAGVVAVWLLARALPAASRRQLRHAVLVLGCLVAATGWLGVVAHLPDWGFAARLWRASSTLTYPNATAALLVLLALVAISARVDAPAGRWLDPVTTVLLLGAGATLSRAGGTALLVGLAVLALRLGPRPVLSAVAGPALGAAVAGAALLPAMAAPRPGAGTTFAAVAGLAGGIALASTVRDRRALVGGWLLVAVASAPLVPVLGDRLTLHSPDRWASIRAAWRLVVDHPWTGVGPGLERLTWSHPDGGSSVHRYAHNEYVQVAAELGVLGALLLVALLLGVVVRLSRVPGAASAGAVAGVAALAVHSGFDFIWHLPAIPLTAAVLVGLASPEGPAGSTNESKGNPDDAFEEDARGHGRSGDRRGSHPGAGRPHQPRGGVLLRRAVPRRRARTEGDAPRQGSRRRRPGGVHLQRGVG